MNTLQVKAKKCALGDYCTQKFLKGMKNFFPINKTRLLKENYYEFTASFSIPMVGRVFSS